MTQSNQLVEFDYYISPDGETFTLMDGVNNFLISFTGYGMPPIIYQTQRGPFQHGVTPLSFRLQPRTITLIYSENGCSREQYWNVRSNILNILRPNRQSANSFGTGVLRKILPDGTTRDLSVLIANGPRFQPRNLSQWDEHSIFETLVFTAFDPTFFDPTEVELVFDLQSLEELVFPIQFTPTDPTDSSLVFGGEIIDETQTITYTGTWLTYPTITIIGPLNNLIITNQDTDEKIKLDYNISIGETVTINLVYGNKSVENQLETNLIGTVTTDSDLATFHIASDPEAPDGENTIRVEGSDAVVGITNIVIAYFIRDIGI